MLEYFQMMPTPWFMFDSLHSFVHLLIQQELLALCQAPGTPFRWWTGDRQILLIIEIIGIMIKAVKEGL